MERFLHSTLCIAEDRKSCEFAVKLLLKTLYRHSPGLEINLFYPPADAQFVAWVKQFPTLTLHKTDELNGMGWNVKPTAIRKLLDSRYDEVIWLDADIIITRDIAPIFAGLAPEVVVATEEALWGMYSDTEGFRARQWGLPVGRVLPFSLNTAVLRMTRAHYPLLGSWQHWLNSRQYQDAQRMEWDSRPVHLVGDQDVLTALLASEEFSAIPLKILMRGEDVLQYFGLYGYTTVERLASIVGKGPAFVHSQGHKPWLESWQIKAPKTLKKYLEKVYLDLSPYTLAARHLADDPISEMQWTRPHFMLSAFLRALGLWYPPLVGLPIALSLDVLRSLQRVGSAMRDRDEPQIADGPTKKPSSE